MFVNYLFHQLILLLTLIFTMHVYKWLSLWHRESWYLWIPWTTKFTKV